MPVNKKQIDLLSKIAHKDKITKKGLEDREAYLSNVDKSFICFNPENINFLLKKGITEQVQNSKNNPNHTSNIGFNPVEQKWYGWSHRAIFGFSIGSIIKLGNCGFKPSNEQEFIEKSLSFWGEDEYHSHVGYRVEENENRIKGVLIYWTYSNDTPNEKLRGTMGSYFCEYPKKWGKGEWVAKTLEDAKQMAIDFAQSVS